MTLYVDLEACCVEVSGRIQDIHQVVNKIYCGFLLHLFFQAGSGVFAFDSLTRSIFCERLLFTLSKPFDIIMCSPRLDYIMVGGSF